MESFWSRLFPGDAAASPDPIDHPTLAAMSPTELADLPLWPAPAAAADETPAGLPARARPAAAGAKRDAAEIGRRPQPWWAATVFSTEA